jgi:Fic family protein
MHRITNITITPEILKLIAEIDEFKGRWTVIETLAPEKLTTLRRIATIESVGSSTRIEGSKLSDAEVEKLLSGLHTKSFASRDEEEVAGYADAMDMIFEGYDAIASTENHIKQLHGVLLKYSSKDQDHCGQYKTVTNHVEAFGPDGKSLGVVFETATPFETPGWMKDLVDWFNRAVEEESHHPLILIGIFIVVFLAIHPFKDGNGRLSRALTTLLLEEQALRSSLAALSRQILELAKTRGEVTVKEIEDSTGANRNTIKVHVKKLAEQQYLRQVGQGRGARYTIK